MHQLILFHHLLNRDGRPAGHHHSYYLTRGNCLVSFLAFSATYSNSVSVMALIPATSHSDSSSSLAILKGNLTRSTGRSNMVNALPIPFSFPTLKAISFINFFRLF